ncbi:MAG: glycosyltransferase family 4 protein [Bacteroidales bacterium]
MKLKVINIVNHPPAYDAHRDRPRPKINWDLPNGSWVGIWGYEWHDIIGNKVLEIADDIEYEVWQPDLRADKIYEHTFETGLKHRSFPAVKVKVLHGIRYREDVYSQLLMDELEKEYQSGIPLVLHINAGFRYINTPVLNKYWKKIPIVGQFYTNSLNIFDLPKTKNPYKFIHGWLKRRELFNYYKKIKFIIPGVSEGMEYFEEKFGTQVFRRDFANFGGNINELQRKISKEEARQKLNIPGDKYILFSSSRLVPVKQVDKLIVALAGVKNKNFICYISGRGTEEYESYLKKLVKDNFLGENIRFINYVDYNILLEYFQAVDLLVSTSMQDAGPSAPFQASAMGTPSLITNTGLAAEFFKLTGSGIIVPVDNYPVWEQALESCIAGKTIKIPSRDELEKFGDWGRISKYYYESYKIAYNSNERKNWSLKL